tara:strand:- start:277 stop:495 length:219 start_codon:yes stop_codon:yes gene_type:complete
MKIEFVKPVFHIDKFFKVADTLIRCDDQEMIEVGRGMRKAYENQMVEVDEESHEDKGGGVYAPENCKTENCD